MSYITSVNTPRKLGLSRANDDVTINLDGSSIVVSRWDIAQQLGLSVSESEAAQRIRNTVSLLASGSAGETTPSFREKLYRSLGVVFKLPTERGTSFIATIETNNRRVRFRTVLPREDTDEIQYFNEDTSTLWSGEDVLRFTSQQRMDSI